MRYDHCASVVRGLVLEIMVHAAAGQVISLSNAARLPVEDQDLPHVSMAVPGSLRRGWLNQFAVHVGPADREPAGCFWGATGPCAAVPIA